jgi:nickel-dependent lactate racemase
MQIHLAYGKTGLDITLPDDWDVTVIEPEFVTGLADPLAALQDSLRRPYRSAPLSDLVRPGDRVGIIFSDITRPTPHRLILPAVLDELAHISAESITLFNALGTHRPNTDTELCEMLGDELVERYPVVQNNAFDPSTQVCLGKTGRGHEIWLNRKVVECDWKILTGFIEPHFFAGFSGGGKALMPGMAGLQTVLGNHDAGMIADPKAGWGVTQGNPIWEEVREVTQSVGGLFLLNVTLNKHKEITGVFAGELDSAHQAGCAFNKATAMQPVDEPFDIVVTTNSGYPLDLNLYQAVKGMSAAAQVVRPGGTIIVAADCWDGIPEHGLYSQLLRQARSPRELLDVISTPGFLKQDQWQAQIQAQIQMKADVFVYSHNLTDEQIRAALLQPCRSIPTLLGELRQKYGSGSRICILPEGPQTVPFFKPIDGI